MRPWLVRFDLHPFAAIAVACLAALLFLGWSPWTPVEAPGGRRWRLQMALAGIGVLVFSALAVVAGRMESPSGIWSASWGYVGVPGYYFWLTTGFLLTVSVVLREARRSHVDPRYMLDMCLLILFGSMIGARLGHIVFERPMVYLRDPLKLFRVWEGGLVFYGGLIFCVSSVAAYCRYRKVSFAKACDVIAPAVALGTGFGRIGCFSAGCCYGRPIDQPLGVVLPWGVSFFGGQVPEALQAVLLHPSQNYQSFVGLIAFLVVMRVRTRQRFDGQAAMTFAAVYAVGRSTVELFRFDLERVVYWNLVSTSQLISLPIFLGALFLLWRGHRRAQGRGGAGSWWA